MVSSLPRSRPVDHHVDPAAILAFLDAMDGHPGIEMHSVMVVRHGHVVAEGWWAPYSAGRPQLLYSLSKSFTSTAAAFAQAEGLLDLDDTVVSHFAEFEPDITNARSRSMKIRHIAAMASGHGRDTLASIIQRNAGMPLTQYLRPRLLDPLGIGPVGWHTLPSGHEQGFSGLHARTRGDGPWGSSASSCPSTTP